MRKYVHVGGYYKRSRDKSKIKGGHSLLVVRDGASCLVAITVLNRKGKWGVRRKKGGRPRRKTAEIEWALIGGGK